MTVSLGNRIFETSTTTGTGTFSLAGSIAGRQTFVEGVGDGSLTYYSIFHTGGSVDEWEVGLGTVTDASPDTLARTTVLGSSNSGAAVNFSSGTKHVYGVIPASVLEGCRTWHPTVRVATTENGTLATAFANGQTVDGVTLATGDRILLQDQSTASENGIYTVNASGAPTRADDLVAKEQASGIAVLCLSGTANAGKVFYCSAASGSDVVGTNNLTFAKLGVTAHAEAVNPPQITSDQNNYDPGAASATTSRNVLAFVDTDAARTITGLALSGGNVAGDTVTIFNDGSNALDFAHDSGSSTAANQLQLRGGFALRLFGGDCVTLVHNGTDWKEIDARVAMHSTCLTRDTGQSLDSGVANHFEFDNADWNHGSIGVVSSNFSITGVDTSAETFTVSGDQTASFVAGSRFRVKGSTGNDGVWVVSSSSYSTSTVITVTGDITDATVDGTIHREGVHIKRAGIYDVDFLWGALGIDDGEFARADIDVNGVLTRLDQRYSPGAGLNSYPARFSTLSLAEHDFVEGKAVHDEGAAFNSQTEVWRKPTLTVVERGRA